ncbi:hypothetical protein D3C71_2009660 [compost metagenome]
MPPAMMAMICRPAAGSAHLAWVLMARAAKAATTPSTTSGARRGIRPQKLRPTSLSAQTQVASSTAKYSGAARVARLKNNRPEMARASPATR